MYNLLQPLALTDTSSAPYIAHTLRLVSGSALSSRLYLYRPTYTLSCSSYQKNILTSLHELFIQRSLMSAHLGPLPPIGYCFYSPPSHTTDIPLFACSTSALLLRILFSSQASIRRHKSNKDTKHYPLPSHVVAAHTVHNDLLDIPFCLT